MGFDRMEAFEEIDRMLSEVRIKCNRAQIPFIWVAAVADGPKGTKYRVAVDGNTKVDPEETEYVCGELDTADEDEPDGGEGKKKGPHIRYFCNTITPGSMEIDLKDDRIRDIIKVLLGFKVIPKESAVYYEKPEEFTYDAIFPETRELYERKDDGNGFIYEASADDVDLFSGEIEDTEEPDVVELDYDGNGLPDCEDDYAGNGQEPRTREKAVPQ